MTDSYRRAHDDARIDTGPLHEHTAAPAIAELRAEVEALIAKLRAEREPEALAILAVGLHHFAAGTLTADEAVQFMADEARAMLRRAGAELAP